jgi:Immunoglobulin I-set domain/von Willebrand factor type A domain/Putative Ig domain
MHTQPKYHIKPTTMKSKTTIYSCLTALGLTFWLGTPPAQAIVSVSVQPTNQVVLVGGSAVFNAQVSTTAGETITGFTWQMSTNGLSPFTTIAGATTATCTLSNVQTINAGSYFTTVTYNSGTSTGLVSVSAAVTLVVHDQARITAQPQGGLIRITGTNVSFSVTALGLAPIRYQWRLNGLNLANGARITGANGADLTVSALLVADSGSYDVVVTNLYAAATSQVATLTVFAPPGIAVPPANLAIITGSNANFSVTPTGSAPLSFRWIKDGTPLSNSGRISGATNNTLTITAATTNDAGGYSVLITNIVGSVTSPVATLTVLVPPTITSATSAAGKQGTFFSFTNTATGTLAITFGADGLTNGLSLEPTNGIISGIPLTTGVFSLTIYATNAAMTTTGQLVLTFTTGAPGITSALAASGKQGQVFSYTIVANNNPTALSVSVLPAGLNFDPVSGIISGPPIVSGIFPITITASNQFGGDAEVLTLTITSAVPVITSARTATGTENVAGFSYTIRASNTPTTYGASGLPLGLSVNTTNGLISGTPWFGGTFTVPVWAANAWGTGTTNVVMTINYATLSGLAITDVINTWSKPFLLDFSFSLRDGTNPVVRPPSQLQVVCMEDGVPISSEAPLILDSVMGSSSKQLKTFLVLDYTYSMFVVPGAIDAMQAAAELLISEEPPHALFGIVEFNADYMAPQFVTNSLTTTNNYFITDKTVLNQSIAGIQTNYVKGNYAGTRCWDAMYAALNQFGTNITDEQRYLVAMTDGNDDSSDLNTTFFPTNAIDVLVQTAQANNVAIYCVAFGGNVNTNSLQQLTSQTSGQYYLAATTTNLGSQFERIQKDISSQYVLRWATLKRATVPAYPVNGFQPSFQITYGGFTASWNTTIVTTNIVDDPGPPVVSHNTNVVQFPFDPPAWSNDVRVGSLRLVADADLGPQRIRLRAAYVPRSVREIRLNYRPNYPCTTSLDSTGTNGILQGWTMTETADTNGLRTLTMISSDTNNLLTSIPYAAFGELVEFDFKYPESVTATQAFSSFSVDNSIYTNFLPSGVTFTNQNFTNFITLYAVAPPYGTPVPWLIYYGFKTNFVAAELIATNGLPVWQDYLAGLNPTNANSKFTVSTAFALGQAPQIIFSTVVGRTYRVETATSLGSWMVLRDNIIGIGGNILFIDNRVLSGVSTVFYRVAVY